MGLAEKEAMGFRYRLQSGIGWLLLLWLVILWKAPLGELREALREGGDIKAEIEEVGREGLFYNSFLA